MLPTDSEVLLTFGVLLAVALFSGKLAILLRLPQVTAYLLVGVLFGPSVLNLVPREHVDLLEPLTELAVALVLFDAGLPVSVGPRAAHLSPRRAAVAWRTLGNVSGGRFGIVAAGPALASRAATRNARLGDGAGHDRSGSV